MWITSWGFPLFLFVASLELLGHFKIEKWNMFSKITTCWIHRNFLYTWAPLSLCIRIYECVMRFGDRFWLWWVLLHCWMLWQLRGRHPLQLSEYTWYCEFVFARARVCFFWLVVWSDFHIDPRLAHCPHSRLPVFPVSRKLTHYPHGCGFGSSIVY